MPELPEVETVRRGLETRLLGRRFKAVQQNRADLRWLLPGNLKQVLTGRKIIAVGRRAKYLTLTLDNDWVLLVHLGMSGRFFVASNPYKTAKHDHVVFTLDQKETLIFNDPRRFGHMDLVKKADLATYPLLAKLGPDPFDKGFTAARLGPVLAKKKVSMKAALMDQRVMAGLGNIYVSEALFYAHIDPHRLASSVTPQEVKALIPAIRKVLTAAIEAGGSSLRDYVQADGKLGYFQHKFSVYNRESKACPGCTCKISETGGVNRIVQNGRSTFYCPRRQW